MQSYPSHHSQSCMKKNVFQAKYKDKGNEIAEDQLTQVSSLT